MPAVVNRILVPVDFSACSRAALGYAVQLAAQTGAAVDVLYVHEPSRFIPDSLAVLFGGGMRGPGEQARGDVKGALEGFLGAVRSRVRNVRVESGIAGDVIASTAREGQFDLVVMGTHGQGGLTRLVLGSVAESVMRKAEVPVLTLRMPKRESRERVPL